ncbi:hypothetical protein BV923_00710 [Pectobacterium odoriferum]|uniref:DUF3800 domain-containing protein n=1 Tax=Pectobacterium odoriferum TaxID=78398 RepID=UPI000CD27F58|nr:DUF3800 domain-containing protein [Pectobacterium odoriferum]POE24978.1 hypothetical protein BV923_00710 [Pectobacterium odoriferum]
MSQKIYFDESGFTGDNLLSPNQEFFSYASVATDAEESKDIVEGIIKKYNIQNGELKGSRLLNSSKCHRAVDEILTHFHGRMRSTISDKKYALAGKFFEYVFEPVIANKSSIFYNLNFHLFISNYLHVEFIAKDETAHDLYHDFEDIMRSKKELSVLLTSPKNDRRTQVFQDIIDFTNLNKSKVEEELSSLEGDGHMKWILDLTTTSLFTLLADWGTKYEQITAICDSSKPLINDQEIFNAMINRTEKLFNPVLRKKIPLTFNLEKQISLSDSKTHHGIQIADVIAAVSVYLTNGKNSEQNLYKKWSKYFDENVFYWPACVVPSYEDIDLDRIETIRNVYLLNEITNRSRNGNPVLDGIEKDIIHIDRILRLYAYHQ